jgi:hypothetical protein
MAVHRAVHGLSVVLVSVAIALVGLDTRPTFVFGDDEDLHLAGMRRTGS